MHLIIFNIIFPQAIKNVLPALGNEFITLVKETSIGAYIGILWLETFVGRAMVGIFGGYFKEFDIYEFHQLFLGGMIITTALGAIYFFVCKYLMEKRLNLN
jgi:ABC-type amino acid transport system permease subunit